MKKSDRYTKIVEWSEEDRCYVGTCPELFDGGCHGSNKAEVYRELCDIVEENIALYEERGGSLPSVSLENTARFPVYPGGFSVSGIPGQESARAGIGVFA